MGSFDVLQRTSDGMFCATELLKQWNRNSGDKKEITKFFDNANTSEFISALISEENLNTQNSAYLKTRGKNGGTWMHPYLFVKFAMWLNPRFEVKVIKFVYDQLIQYRNEAGDTYRDMCAAIASISEKKEVSSNIQIVAKSINIIIFGKHQREARNKMAEEASMKELLNLQMKIAELISFGFIKDFSGLKEYIKAVWNKKYLPKELAS